MGGNADRVIEWPCLKVVGVAILVAGIAASPLSCAAAVAAEPAGTAVNGSGESAEGESASESAFEEAGEMEEVVVTGSRLLRRGYGSPSPIAILTREDFEFTGQQTLETALSQMPQFTPSFDRTANNPGNGRAYVNLRGLGPHRTLVMLNGRRLGPSGVGSEVDVNNLPQALIESAEIITGGASTVYGSDAVAGVINFTIRQDFEGLGFDVNAYMTGEGDSNIYDFSLSYGHNFAGGRGNITVFGGYYDREETYADARLFTSVPWADHIFTGELAVAGSPRVPEGSLWFPRVDFGNGPSRTIFDPDGNPREFVHPVDLYNYAPWNYLQVPMDRHNAGLMFHYDLTDRSELYVEATYSRSETQRVLAPVPAVEWLLINTDNPVLTPATRQLFIDNLIPIEDDIGIGLFSKRFEEFGPRVEDLTSEYTRLLTGLRGDIGHDWSYDVWTIYTENDEEEVARNDGSRSRLQQGLLVDPASGQCFDPSDGCVPVDIFGIGRLSPEAINFVRGPPHGSVTHRSQATVSGFVRGKLFENWAGPVEAVGGGEWRRDKGRFDADEYLFTDDSLGYFGRPSVLGEEQVYEAFAEILVPLSEDRALIDYLALELGYRYSKYDHADSVGTYKFGLQWRPVAGIGLRGMFQRAVRAPNLREAFAEQLVQDDFLVTDDPTADPCSVSSDPVGDGNVEKCVATGLPVEQIGVFEASQFPTRFVSGGNPDLESESADTVTAGIVLTFGRFPNFQVSVDYFEIELEGEIGQLAALEACFDPANTGVLFCDNISRDAASFNVDEVREYNINRGVSRTAGVDTQLSYRMALPAALSTGGAGAELSVDVFWTHVIELTSQNTPFSTVIDCTGTFGWPCTDLIDGMTWPSDRVTSRFNYRSGDFAANLTWRWVDGSENGAYTGAPLVGIDPAELVLAVPGVGRKNYFDFSFSYLFGEHVRGLFTIANLTDTDPPMMADWVWDKNTDTRMYDIFGRSYTLSLLFLY